MLKPIIQTAQNGHGPAEDKMTVLVQQSETMKNFMDNLKVKIRDDIASMLPDSVINEMAQQVVKDEFLTKKKVKDPNGGYYAKEVEIHCEFQKLVIDAATPIIKKYIEDYVQENKDLITAQIHEILSNGIQELFTSVLKKSILKFIVDDPYAFRNALENSK